MLQKKLSNGLIEEYGIKKVGIKHQLVSIAELYVTSSIVFFKLKK